MRRLVLLVVVSAALAGCFRARAPRLQDHGYYEVCVSACREKGRDLLGIQETGIPWEAPYCQCGYLDD
jgi:hypothetical protein